MLTRIAIWFTILAQPLLACRCVTCPCPKKAESIAPKKCCSTRTTESTPKGCRLGFQGAKPNSCPLTCCGELRRAPSARAEDPEHSRNLHSLVGLAIDRDADRCVSLSGLSPGETGARALFASNTTRQATLGVWLK